MTLTKRLSNFLVIETFSKSVFKHSRCLQKEPLKGKVYLNLFEHCVNLLLKPLMFFLLKHV